MRIAVISDIHGNSWALKRVMSDIETRNPDLIVNLGDSLYGPLDPGETFELLKSREIISISGNEDRLIAGDGSREGAGRTMKFVKSELSEEAITWLQSLPAIKILHDKIFLCHGTPDSDSTYLTEQLSEQGLSVYDTLTIESFLSDVKQKFIFCGHSHLPRVIKTASRGVVNPGSVGCPAFEDDVPFYHKIQNFNNNAQYCMVDLQDDEILTEQVSLPYDFEKAADRALKLGFKDWARWITTGSA